MYVYVFGVGLVTKSHLTLVTPQTVNCQDPVSMVLSRQEYWSGFPCPPPGDLPNQGVELASLGFPALSGSFFTTEPPGKPPEYEAMVVYICLIVLVIWKSQFLKSHS